MGLCCHVFVYVHVSISIQEHDVVVIPQVKGKCHNTNVLHVGVFFCGFMIGQGFTYWERCVFVCVCILNIFNLFQSVRLFICACVHGIKKRHLIGRRNDVAANMVALAVCICLAASCLLDIRRSSVWVFQVRHTLAQKLTVIVCYKGTALPIDMWVFLFHYLGTLAVSALGC